MYRINDVLLFLSIPLVGSYELAFEHMSRRVVILMVGWIFIDVIDAHR